MCLQSRQYSLQLKTCGFVFSQIRQKWECTVNYILCTCYYQDNVCVYSHKMELFMLQSIDYLLLAQCNCTKLTSFLLSEIDVLHACGRESRVTWEAENCEKMMCEWQTGPSWQDALSRAQWVEETGQRGWSGPAGNRGPATTTGCVLRQREQERSQRSPGSKRIFPPRRIGRLTNRISTSRSYKGAEDPRWPSKTSIVPDLHNPGLSPLISLTQTHLVTRCHNTWDTHYRM